MHENFRDTGGLAVPRTVRRAVIADVLEHKRNHNGFMPPTHQHSGENSARAGVGLPGHCAFCAIVGHVVAHPEDGCGDVHCNDDHENDAVLETDPLRPVVGVAYCTTCRQEKTHAKWCQTRDGR